MSTPLRRALSESGAELAFIISDYVYKKLVVRRRGLADRNSFRAVRTRVKRTSVHAWIYVPAEPAPEISWIYRSVPGSVHWP